MLVAWIIFILYLAFLVIFPLLAIFHPKVRAMLSRPLFKIDDE